ncbi:MAG: hypothetical protein ACI8UR_002383 [Natronomonas sp.]|jgi:hypothetical protein|uniref:hypothetical protein n=1 Tax=Natronomonas sp. TaxID=2184060 RepID=UPI003988D7F3
MSESPEIVGRLKRNLMSLGVYVERHALEEETVHVEYETAAEGLTTNDIGNVCTELVDAHEAGWEPRDLHFWAFGTDGVGTFLGEWEVHAGWLYALDNGNISQTDFSTLVLSTRQPPEAGPGAEPSEGSESPTR